MPSNQPPTIPGLTYKGFLGSGGFADVYLYESATPVRNVAVKVLHDKALSPTLVNRFAAEANTMAALEHPFIVRVYSSGLTTDGRPYIEMAYYPEETLAQAVKRGPLPVVEVLRIGVQLASAIEAAHQVGLMHRDIKPANVLIDKFGDPALTDFGIASHLHEADQSDASLSVPWSPPEAMFATSSLDRRGDVYSLAATLWHLLVGHAPFEVPGGDNKPNATMLRIRDLPVPSTGRGDVPASLERLLRQAMSKDPKLRPATAEDFARSLNAIEEEMRLRPTAFKIARAGSRLVPVNPPSDAEDGTRIRSAPPVVPASPTSSPLAPSASVLIPDATRRRDEPATLTPNPLADATRLKLRATPDMEDEEAGSPRRALIIGIAIAVMIVGGIAAWIVFGPQGTGWRPNPPTPTVSDDDFTESPNAIPNTIPGTPHITSVIKNDEVTFKWTYERADKTDIFNIDGPDGEKIQYGDNPTYTVHYGGIQVCIKLRISRGDGSNPQQNATESCTA